MDNLVEKHFFMCTRIRTKRPKKTCVNLCNQSLYLRELNNYLRPFFEDMRGVTGSWDKSWWWSMLLATSRILIILIISWFFIRWCHVLWSLTNWKNTCLINLPWRSRLDKKILDKKIDHSRQTSNIQKMQSMTNTWFKVCSIYHGRIWKIGIQNV